MDHDKNGNPQEVPSIVDKLAPVQEMRKRRMKLEFLRDAIEHGQGSLADLVHEERRIFIDALEYVEVFSDDAFCRLMARHALGKRPR